MMASEERYLWVFQYQLHGESRIWWAYFKDWSEIQACIAEIMRAFPCFELWSLEACQDGLTVLSYYYNHKCSLQECADILRGEAVYKREKQLFPLAPLPCGYVSSFVAGLGDAVLCERCEALSRAYSLVR